MHRLIAVASLVVEGSGHKSFSSCSSWTLDHWLSSCGASVLLLRHVESSRIGHGTVSPALAELILIHCAARKF